MSADFFLSIFYFIFSFKTFLRSVCPLHFWCSAYYLNALFSQTFSSIMAIFFIFMFFIDGSMPTHLDAIDQLCVCVWGPLRLRTPPYMGFSMRKTIRIMCWERSHYQRLALIVSLVVKVDLHPSDINTEFLYVRSTMNFWSAAASLYQSIGRFVHFSFSWGI